MTTFIVFYFTAYVLFGVLNFFVCIASFKFTKKQMVFLFFASLILWPWTYILIVFEGVVLKSLVKDPKEATYGNSK